MATYKKRGGKPKTKAEKQNSIEEGSTTDKSDLLKEFQTQAIIYQKIVNVLQSKVNSGVVTLNLWDMGERFKKPDIYFQSIYDSNFEPTPAYSIIKKALINNQ